MVQANNLLAAAKQIGVYVMITLGVYLGAIVALIVAGFVEEDVITALGLASNGSAVTNIGTLFTAFYLAITTITGIVTVITGLLTLNVVLQAFGIKLNLSMGSRV